MAKLTTHKRGFTIFFAVLVASLSLAVGVVIYDLLIRSLSLSQVTTQSQYAIYAADTGAECALYWDLKFASIAPADTDGSAFATSSKMTPNDEANSSQAVVCNNQNIITPSAIAGFSNTVGNTNTGWDDTVKTATAATTTFWISTASSAVAPCAKVEVAKTGNPPQTTIVSHGYNTCAANSSLRLERTLQVNY